MEAFGKHKMEHLMMANNNDDNRTIAEPTIWHEQ